MTDIHEDNIIISIPDQEFFDTLLASKCSSPSACRFDGKWVVYVSISLDTPDDPGEPVISDFRDAYFGKGPFIR